MLSPLIITDGWKAPRTPQSLPSGNKIRLSYKELDLSFDNALHESHTSPSKSHLSGEMNSMKIKLLARTGMSVSRISLLSGFVSRASTNTSCQQSISSQYEEFKDSEIISSKYILNQKALSAPKVLVDSASFKELFEKTDRQVREKYLNTLKYNKILGSKYKTKCQAFVILDWEGALFCGSDLEDVKNNDFTTKGKPTLRSLDKAISSLLDEIIEYSQVFILTSYNENTVRYSAQLYLPLTHKVITRENIQVICTRALNGGLSVMKEIFPAEIATNMVCAVESHAKIEAMESLGKELKAPLVKIVKFKEFSKVAELIKQQEVLLKEFENIFFGLRSFTLQLAKKKV